MEFIVFYLQFIYCLEGLGMFFPSAALVYRLRGYAATHSVLYDSANYLVSCNLFRKFPLGLLHISHRNFELTENRVKKF